MICLVARFRRERTLTAVSRSNLLFAASMNSRDVPIYFNMLALLPQQNASWEATLTRTAIISRFQRPVNHGKSNNCNNCKVQSAFPTATAKIAK